MILTFSAIIEKDGRLRPVNPVALPAGTEVAVTVQVEEKSTHPRRAAEILAEIAALPVRGTPDPNTSAEHDRILYGERGTP